MGSRILSRALPAVIVLAGCASDGLRDPLDQTASSTLVASSSRSALYGVNVDEGTVSVFEPGVGVVQEIQVGVEPTRIARSGNNVYVTLRGERGIAVMHEEGDQLVLDRTVATGAEPYGIVASQDGTAIFVALSSEDAVVHYDADLNEVERFAVEGQPRWLSLAPSGEDLYVGSAYGGEVTWIDLDSLTVNDLDLPDGQNHLGDDLSIRITGDIAVSPDGQMLAIPVTYVDNERPVSDPSEDVTTDGYSGGISGTPRFTPAVVMADLSGNGAPTVRPLPMIVNTTMLFGSGDTGMIFADAEAVDGDIDEPAGSVDAPYVSSLTFSPDSGTIWASLESTASVVALSSYDIQGTKHPRLGETRLTPQEFANPASVYVDVGAGPNGVVFLSDDDVFAHGFLDRSITDLRASDVKSMLQSQERNGFREQANVQGVDRGALTTSKLPADIEQGRRLFFAADDSRMSAGGVSCATCHMDTRNDGLTWVFDDGATRHQTPSLAGPVSMTAPVTWSSQVPSVATEVHVTSTGRMGGSGLSSSDELLVARYIDSTRDADVPLRGSDDPAIARGKAIFEREDVACASCHNGERYTDNLNHDLLGERGTNTPGLVGIAVTAPYFHDGRAANLEEVIEASDQRLMGDTSMLSASEKADLIVYLRSL